MSSAVGLLMGSEDNDGQDFAFLLLDFFFLGGILRVLNQELLSRSDEYAVSKQSLRNNNRNEINKKKS